MCGKNRVLMFVCNLCFLLYFKKVTQTIAINILFFCENIFLFEETILLLPCGKKFNRYIQYQFACFILE